MQISNNQSTTSSATGTTIKEVIASLDANIPNINDSQLTPDPFEVPATDPVTYEVPLTTEPSPFKDNTNESSVLDPGPIPSHNAAQNPLPKGLSHSMGPPHALGPLYAMGPQQLRGPPHVMGPPSIISHPSITGPPSVIVPGPTPALPMAPAPSMNADPTRQLIGWRVWYGGSRRSVRPKSRFFKIVRSATHHL